MKEARHKRSHIVRFHLGEITRIIKSRDAENRLQHTEKVAGGRGRREWEVTA